MVSCYGFLRPLPRNGESVSGSQLLTILSQRLGDAILIQTVPSIVWLSAHIPLPPPRITRIAIGITRSIPDTVAVKVTDHGNAWV